MLCGHGCRYEEEREECHEKYVDTVSDTPVESCNLTPIKTCHQVTKLTPVLSPRQECSVVPHQVCSLGVNKSVQSKPVIFCFVSFSELSSHFETSLADFVIIEIQLLQNGAKILM